METIANGGVYELPTMINGAPADEPIKVTEAALEKIMEIRKENSVPAEYYLRLGTRSGGCHGMNYILGFDAALDEGDRSFKLGDLELVVDSKSVFYLMGVTLDFMSNEYGSGFVFNNPNDSHTCGCGN
ncbi:MAG: HesB/IscA family protein [Chloroflexota bacterium]